MAVNSKGTCSLSKIKSCKILITKYKRAVAPTKRDKIKKKAPDFQITWVHPYSKSIIEVGLEFPQKMSYRKGLNVSKLATEVEDETGVTIVLL